MPLRLSRLIRNLPWPYGVRGTAYRRKGEYEQAITDTSEAIRLDPKDARAYAARGEIYRLKAEYDKAIIDTSDAIRLDPRYPAPMPLGVGPTGISASMTRPSPTPLTLSGWTQKIPGPTLSGGSLSRKA